MKNGAGSRLHDRRRFLLGAGGVSLLLPVLPSLFGRNDAKAAVAKQKRFFYVGSGHGGLSMANMYPSIATTSMTAVEIIPGMTSHWAPLTGTVNGTDTVISTTMSAPTSALGSKLIGKMNLLRGIGLPAGYGHHSGVHLGNNIRNDQGPKGYPDIPTIDQVMAYSPSFYGQGDSYRARDLTVGTGKISYTYQNPATRTGVQANNPVAGTSALFDKLFPPGTGTQMPMATRPLIIDRVVENYRSLRNSNRRLSLTDRARLDDHVARLAELQRTLSVQPSLSCGSPTKPTEALPLHNSAATNSQYYDTLMSVVAAGLACGASRVGSVYTNQEFVPYTGDWHQEVAHQFSDPAKQALLVQEFQVGFVHAFLSLANRLDGITDADGSTVLDNTLLMFGQEAGFETHGPMGVPVVTAGSAGGFMKTGRYVDYRSLLPIHQNTDSSHKLMPDNYTGLFWPQLLATALQAMDIPEAEWAVNQPPENKGYGLYPPLVGTYQNWANNKSTIPTGAGEQSSNPLPLIT